MKKTQRTYRNFCFSIYRILYCRSIFFNRSNRRRKNRIRHYRSITCFYYRLGNWFSIRWNYWIRNKPCKRFRPKNYALYSSCKRQQRLGICMDSSYCTVNRRSISSTILPCITIIFIQLY